MPPALLLFLGIGGLFLLTRKKEEPVAAPPPPAPAPTPTAEASKTDEKIALSEDKSKDSGSTVETLSLTGDEKYGEGSTFGSGAAVDSGEPTTIVTAPATKLGDEKKLSAPVMSEGAVLPSGKAPPAPPPTGLPSEPVAPKLTAKAFKL